MKEGLRSSHRYSDTGLQFLMSPLSKASEAPCYMHFIKLNRMESMTILIYFTGNEEYVRQDVVNWPSFITYFEFWSLGQLISFAVVTREWAFSLCPRKVTE